MINDTLNDDTSKAGKTNVSDARCEAADEGGTRGQPRERVLGLCQARRLFDFGKCICRSVDPGESCTLLKKWFVKMEVWYYRTTDPNANVRH